MLRELNLKYRALESAKTDEKDIDGMKKNQFCVKGNVHAELVLYKYFAYIVNFWCIVINDIYHSIW